MEKIKLRLMLEYPFFGSLALTMPLISVDNIPTVSTNGKNIFYNPDYTDGLTSAHRLFLYVHEICHVILGHSVRRGSRNQEAWNIAADYAVNLLIYESTDLDRPIGGLFDTIYHKWSTERIYEKIMNEFGDEIERDADDDLSDNEWDRQERYENIVERSQFFGSVTDSLPEDNVSEADIHSSAALIDRILTATGNPPSTRLREFVTTFVTSKIRWQDLLLNFISESCAKKYSWLRPNTRYRGEGGMIMPSLQPDPELTIVVALDTSGSVDKSLLSEFTTELKILINSVSYYKIIVMSCSDQVYNPRHYYKGDEIGFEFAGGTTTVFAPVFEYVVKNGIKPACIIYFTDLFSDTFGNQPDCPVLWIGKFSEEWEKAHRKRLPFGRIINME